MKKPLTILDEPQPRNITRADLVMTEGFASGDQIIGASASTNIDPGCGGTYQIAVGIERVQKTRLVEAGIWFEAELFLQCAISNIALIRWPTLGAEQWQPKSAWTTTAIRGITSTRRT